MKALVYTAPMRLEYREQPEPMPGTAEVVVEIDAVGICGSDLHAYLGHDPRRVPPLVLGHEVAGRIVAGAGRGRRVVLNPLITCGRCEDCESGRANLCRQRELIGMNRPGAFAERIVIPQRNLIALPEEFDSARAALTEPAATALHALVLADRAAWRPLGEARALVIGAGSVGLCAALLLRDRGCGDIHLAETNPRRREMAAAAVVCTTFDPVATAVEPDGFALVIDAVGGAASRRTAVSAVRPGGIIVHIGLMDSSGELDVRKITLSEVTLIGTYTYTTVDLRAALAKLHAGALGALDWIEQRPLAEGAAAFDDLLHGRTAAAKIVLRP